MKIQETYYDALYFASSYLAEGKNFHITLGEKDVLIKLINCSKKKAEITYPNAVIAKHTFKKYDTIKHSITRLGKKGYINIDSTVYNDDGFKRSRVITINWDFIAKIQSIINEAKLHNSDSNTSDFKEDNEETLSQFQTEYKVKPEPSNKGKYNKQSIINFIQLKVDGGGLSKSNGDYLISRIEDGEELSKEDITEAIKYYI